MLKFFVVKYYHMEKFVKQGVFEKINLIFAFWVALMPFFAILFGNFGFATITFQLIYFATLYFLFFAINIKKILENKFIRHFLKSKFILFLVALLFVWIILSSIINGCFNQYTIFYFSYFNIFLFFFLIYKKYYKTIFNVFVGVLLFSVILSLIFPNTSSVPGFFENDQGYSMQFGNPNFSGYNKKLFNFFIF